MTASTPSGQLASITPPKDDAVFAALIAAAQRRLVELQPESATGIPFEGSAISVAIGVENEHDTFRAWIFEDGVLTLVSESEDPAPSVEPAALCTYDPETDKVVPVEPAEWMVSGIPHRVNPLTGALEPEPVKQLSPGVQQLLDSVRQQDSSPHPITESLMRQAQVGWVVRTDGGRLGQVTAIDDDEGLFIAHSGDSHARFYFFKHAGEYLDKERTGFNLVSLAPPAVADDVAEVGV